MTLKPYSPEKGNQKEELLTIFFTVLDIALECSMGDWISGPLSMMIC
jgi:hypothetical protein